MRRTTKLAGWLLVLSGLVVAVGACGDDDDGGDDAAGDETSDEAGSEGPPSGTATEGEFVAAISETLVTVGVPEDRTECAAQVYVDVIGLDQLNELTTPEDIRTNANPASLGVDVDQAGIDAFYEGLSQCFDVREFLVSSVSGDDEALAECFTQAISDDVLKDVIVGGFLRADQAPDQEEQAALEAAYSECTGAAPSEP